MDQKTLYRGVRVLAVNLILMGGLIPFAHASSELIREVEKLRNSLSVRDPSRSALTLRLADLVFNETVALGRNPTPTDTQVATLEKRRKDAVSLYREILTGSGGMFPKASGSQKVKVDFQLARLYSDLGELTMADQFWIPLSEQSQIVEIQREATLRLAEKAENASKFKDAEKYYDRVLQLCGGTDVCSFAHYRKGWVYYRQNALAPAKSEMKLALFDSQGKPRDESVRDYILFWGKTETTGHDALVEFDALSEKIARSTLLPTLLNDLADSFYAAGNKVAGTHVLAEVNRKRPEIKHQARLLEEYYGQRSWEEFRSLLSSTMETAQPIANLKSIAAIEAEKILKRLTVQFDGERVTQPAAVEDFKTLVFLYLKLIPFNEHRVKMQDGWLAAEANAETKMNQLSLWTSEEKSQESATRLREIRATLAQKAGRLDTVIEEMKVLSVAYPDQRKYRYHLARALYEQKQYDQALVIFQQLAQPVKGQALGEAVFAIESQNLALDILGMQKRYSDVVIQAHIWTRSENLSQKAQTEKAEFAKIASGAQFEGAVAQGETQAALDQFREFCKQGIHAEKSCENAKVLAVKLKDQSTLLTVLSLKGATPEYASELEAAGYFKKAAELREKLAQGGKLSDSAEFSLKTALLYELDGDMASRDRLLKRVSAQVLLSARANASKKKPVEAEDLLFASMVDAKLLKTEHLIAPWTAAHQLRVAAILEEQGQGSTATRAALLASLQHAGAAWTKHVTAEADRLNAEQGKISIRGKSGQRRFEQRLIALKKLAAWVDRYTSGADYATRIRLLETVQMAHQQFSEEVLSSPLPEGLTPEAVAQIQASLKELANPISEKAIAYQQLLTEQKVKAAQEDSLKVQQASSLSGLSSVSVEELNAAKAALAKDPSDRAALEKLHSYYVSVKQPRLAAYFQGRLR